MVVAVQQTRQCSPPTVNPCGDYLLEDSQNTKSSIHPYQEQPPFSATSSSVPITLVHPRQIRTGIFSSIHRSGPGLHAACIKDMSTAVLHRFKVVFNVRSYNVDLCWPSLTCNLSLICLFDAVLFIYFILFFLLYRRIFSRIFIPF